MTETPGASAIPSDLPLPRDAAGAATLREQLTSDAEWMKDWRTDQGKYSTLGYLRWVEGGADPDAWGRAPATPDEVRSQMTDRELAFDDERIETYAKHIANFDDVTRATIARGLATKQQHDEALRNIERMKNDQVVARRILAGDLAAKEAWIRWNLVASMRVAPANFDWSKPWDGTRA